MDYYARPSLNGSSFQTMHEHITSVTEYSMQFGQRNQLEKICELAGLLHDMGKYAPEFQTHIRKAAANNAAGLESPRSHFDHGSYGAAYLYSDFLPYIEESVERVTAALAKHFVDFMAMILCYHHGGLNDYASIEKRESPLMRRLAPFINGTTNQTSLLKVKTAFFGSYMSHEELNDAILAALHEFRFLVGRINTHASTRGLSELHSNQKKFDLHLVIKYVYSCLIDADRLDAYNFSAEMKLDPVNSIVPYLDRYLDSLNARLNKFNLREANSETESKINDLRSRISDELSAAAKWETGAYTLTVPTGGGKTLASLRFALEHCNYHAGKHSEKTQIIYVLPYTTIIEQNAKEIRETLGCSANELLEHHSAVTFTEENNETREKQFKLLTERWDVPIIFTTQVQFLNAMFAGGSGPIRRLHTLANSVIILDEVQTIPLNCTYMANAAYTTLSTLLNSTVVLCTATQPNLEFLEVPVQLREPKELSSNPAEAAFAFRRMEIIDAMADGGTTFHEMAEWMSSLINNDDSVLIVMNTKNGVKHVYDTLQQGNQTHKLYYLTTYLCPKHRQDRIAKIKEELSLGVPLIVISTNLIECGVDLSFRYVVRNIAGLPSIIQSSGRGNRHGEWGISRTFIVDVKESTGSLKELEAGALCTKRLLYAYGRHPEKYGGSLLSQEAMDDYYRIYSEDAQIKEKMGYPVKVPTRNQTLLSYDLLAERNHEHVQTAKRDYRVAFSYPFRFVSDHFQVIDQITKSVMTQYDQRARELAGFVMSQGHDIGELREYFREIQNYTVNVFDSDYKKLAEAGDLYQVPGTDDLYVLRDGAYSSVFGIQEEGDMGEAIM